MTGDWEKCRLNDLGEIGRGKSRHRPRNAAHLYGGSYPFIQTGDVQNASFRILKFENSYSEDGLQQSKLWPKETLCISIVGANTAATAILGFEACFPDSVIGFNSFDGVFGNYFVKYLFDYMRDQFKNISEGAARENLSLDKMLSVDLYVPGSRKRISIAKVLSAYDDLIEANLKRIKLLEEMAQITYEEWFVRLRFPNHETTPINPETGLPEGWKKIHLNRIAEFTFGFPFDASLFNNKGNGIPIVRIRNIPTLVTEDYTTQTVPEKYIIRSGDLLVGMDGEFHINHWVGADAYLVQRVCKITSNDPMLSGYVSQAIRRPIKYYESTINGATVAHLGKKHLDEIELIIPDATILSKCGWFNHVRTSILQLQSQNILLKEARDLLLPRLMTGLIDIDDYLARNGSAAVAA